jgi:hypothetical protein
VSEAINKSDQQKRHSATRPVSEATNKSVQQKRHGASRPVLHKLANIIYLPKTASLP